MAEAGQQALWKGGRRSSQTRKKKMGTGKGFKGFHLWMCDVDMAIGLWFGQDESSPKPPASGEREG
jgi:hypothetical protein